MDEAKASKFIKPEIGYGGQWRNQSVNVAQLCVPCELSDRKDSVQSSVVFIGTSMCLDHLHAVKDSLNEGLSEESLMGLIYRGKL